MARRDAQKQPNVDPTTGDAEPRFRYCDEADVAYFFGIGSGRFRLFNQIQDEGHRQALPALGATGILMFWVMVDDGADRAADRHSRRHARGNAYGPNSFGRLDRHDSHARICLGRHLHRHLRFMARVAQRLGGVGDGAGDNLLQFHPAGDDDGDLRHRLHRPHDPRLDGRGDDAAIYPHRATQGSELLQRGRQARVAQRADRARSRSSCCSSPGCSPASSSSR